MFNVRFTLSYVSGTVIMVVSILIASSSSSSKINKILSQCVFDVFMVTTIKVRGVIYPLTHTHTRGAHA